MKKPYIIIIAVLVIIVGVVSYNKNNIKSPPTLTTLPSSTSTVITRITPTTNLYTGDWKTCKNEKYGYEFKYPSHWIITTPNKAPAQSDIVEECSNLKYIGLTSTTTYSSSDYSNGNLCVPQVSVGYIPNNEIDTWYNNSKTVDDNYIIESSKYPSNSIVKEYNVDGKTFFASEVSKEYSCQNSLYPMKAAYNNGILLFESRDVSDVILEAMLSTFKFIK